MDRLTSQDDDLFDPADDEDADIPTPLPYSITSYGADIPVDGLVGRLDRKLIVIPEYQRGFVWTITQASRFIESLLLGLPVPGLFLYRDDEPAAGRHQLVVIDGQQRLRSLHAFYKGLFGNRRFTLQGLSSSFADTAFDSLPSLDRERLSDYTIHATIVHQDTPVNDNSSIYTLFERINTGGTPLSPQEIRSCVSRGPFIALLDSLNADPNWRLLFGPTNTRRRDCELILRFLALLYSRRDYFRPMKSFLNAFLSRNRSLRTLPAPEVSARFRQTVSLLATAVGRDVLRPTRSLNASLTEAIMVGTAERLARGDVTDPSAFRDAVVRLVSDSAFLARCTVGTTHVDAVAQRLECAIDALHTVP